MRQGRLGRMQLPLTPEKRTGALRCQKPLGGAAVALRERRPPICWRSPGVFLRLTQDETGSGMAGLSLQALASLQGPPSRVSRIPGIRDPSRGLDKQSWGWAGPKTHDSICAISGIL
ncbi:hypothetical protein N656DRAFT_183363 [Canariomyces notabilis]|uniref:Uncharacterized protein n=1 Tax=Canariomyces notabilis TaxID=2074819 RepID=A0AAN6QIH5_9PEZI|nr:hypothetical protein N656DRAFT_183363 [Canariomyces arenarius]